MKSIKNQYIDLKEGKMSEAQFMRNVRMTLPEYISNVTLFKQAERILINKGIISEIKDDSKTGYYNQDGKEQYSKFNELDNMNAQEIMAGYVMEKQDNPNIDQKEAVKLVIKNLKSDQFYYTNYKLTGIRGLQPTEFTSTKRKPFFDEMEEVNKNGDNFVDEKNKMQIVKEAKIEDVKLLLSDETLKNSQIGDSNGGVSIIYNDYKKIPSEDLNKLRNSFIVDEDRLSDEGETEVYQYYLSDKMNEVMKPDSKLKLKELVRKMMKEMFDGRDNLTDINEGYYDDIAGYTSVSDNGTGFKDNDKVKSKSGQEGFVYDVLKSKEGKALIVVKFQKNGMTTISKYGEGFNDINDISK